MTESVTPEDMRRPWSLRTKVAAGAGAVLAWAALSWGVGEAAGPAINRTAPGGEDMVLIAQNRNMVTDIIQGDGSIAPQQRAVAIAMDRKLNYNGDEVTLDRESWRVSIANPEEAQWAADDINNGLDNTENGVWGIVFVAGLAGAGAVGFRRWDNARSPF